MLFTDLVELIRKIRHNTIKAEAFELLGFFNAIYGVGVGVQAFAFGEGNDKRRERGDVVEADGAELDAAEPPEADWPDLEEAVRDLFVQLVGGA